MTRSLPPATPQAHRYRLAIGLGLAGLIGYWLFVRKGGAVHNPPPAAPTTAFPTDGLLPGVVAIPIGSPGPLMTGAHYLAKVTLTGVLSLLASPARVRDKAAAQGFSSVDVYQAGSVPDYFPDTTPSPSGSTYWLEGDYIGPPMQKVFPTSIGLEIWYLDNLSYPTVPNLGFAPSKATTALVGTKASNST